MWLCHIWLMPSADISGHIIFPMWLPSFTPFFQLLHADFDAVQYFHISMYFTYYYFIFIYAFLISLSLLFLFLSSFDISSFSSLPFSFIIYFFTPDYFIIRQHFFFAWLFSMVDYFDADYFIIAWVLLLSSMSFLWFLSHFHYWFRLLLLTPDFIAFFDYVSWHFDIVMFLSSIISILLLHYYFIKIFFHFDYFWLMKFHHFIFFIDYFRHFLSFLISLFRCFHFIISLFSFSDYLSYIWWGRRLRLMIIFFFILVFFFFFFSSPLSYCHFIFFDIIITVIIDAAD